MRVYYLLLPLALLVLSCNKTADNTEKSSKEKTVKQDSTAYKVNEQYNDIVYQIEAFNLGMERLSNPEIKEYLKNNLDHLKMLQKDYQLKASDNGMELKDLTEQHKKDLYKLSIADTKDFDNIFVLYYKEFLNGKIKTLSGKTMTNEDFNELKNKYGNLLYDQKLYFDVVK